MQSKSSTSNNDWLERPRSSDAMVTARMGVAKKAAGIAVLESEGLNASSAINAFFDYLITNGAMPDLNKKPKGSHPSFNERMAEASEWFNGIDLTLDHVSANREGN
jgi:antitoxin component of RelBE/YafQ-DinJ toxin-antitoxin module